MGVVGARTQLWLAGITGVSPAEAWRRLGPRALTFASLSASLDAEQERWFLWVPVFVGVGIGLYFGLPFEPGWLLILAPLLAAAGLRLSVRRGVITLDHISVAHIHNLAALI